MTPCGLQHLRGLLNFSPFPLRTCRGFFADSYDLFITDGIGNILKNLGPVNSFKTTYVDYTGASHTFTSYTTFQCYQKSGLCSPLYYVNVTESGVPTSGAWVPNPATQFNSEMVPLYQTQTTYLKNGLNNACEWMGG